MTQDPNQEKPTIDSIQNRLQTAIQLELATIPPYLTAMWSINSDDPKSKEAKNAIRSVFMEEMLHMVLAANLLLSINGEVRLKEENIPSYPLDMTFTNDEIANKIKEIRQSLLASKMITKEDFNKFLDKRNFKLNLEKLSLNSLLSFLKVELPNEKDVKDTKSKIASVTAAKGFEDIILPKYTIGDFYKSIIQDLKELGIETYKVENQLTEDYFWQGRDEIVVIKNFEDAERALKIIADQGEGADVDISNLPTSHFGKFASIYLGGEDKLPKTKEEWKICIDNINQGTLKTDVKDSDFCTYNIVPNPKKGIYNNSPELSRLNNEFNYHYTLMLKQLEEGFNGNSKSFYTAIMNGMHKLTPLAKAMMQIDFKDEDDNTSCAAPSFEWNEDLNF